VRADGHASDRRHFADRASIVYLHPVAIGSLPIDDDLWNQRMPWQEIGSDSLVVIRSDTKVNASVSRSLPRSRRQLTNDRASDVPQAARGGTIRIGTVFRNKRCSNRENLSTRDLPNSVMAPESETILKRPGFITTGTPHRASRPMAASVFTLRVASDKQGVPFLVSIIAVGFTPRST